MTAPTDCPVAWCDESDSFHSIHRCYVHSIQLSGGTVRVIGVSVAAGDLADRHLELTLCGTFTETVIELTVDDGRSLGNALVSAARRHGGDTR